MKIGNVTIKRSGKSSQPVRYFVACFICGRGITEKERHTTIKGKKLEIKVCELCRPARGTVEMKSTAYGSQMDLNFSPEGEEYKSNLCPHCGKNPAHAR